MGKTRNTQEFSGGSQFENYDTTNYKQTDGSGYTDVGSESLPTSTERVGNYRVKKVYDSVERKKIQTKQLNRSFSNK